MSEERLQRFKKVYEKIQNLAKGGGIESISDSRRMARALTLSTAELVRILTPQEHTYDDVQADGDVRMQVYRAVGEISAEALSIMAHSKMDTQAAIFFYNPMVSLVEEVSLIDLVHKVNKYADEYCDYLEKNPDSVFSAHDNSGLADISCVFAGLQKLAERVGFDLEDATLLKVLK